MSVFDLEFDDYFLENESRAGIYTLENSQWYFLPQ